jgi:L-malate glycosyltransferase
MTTLRALHQWVPSFAARDAIGNHAIEIRQVLLEMGLESEIYTVDAQPSVRSLSSHYRRCRPDPTGATALLYHLSIGSEMVEHLLARPERLLVDYHNITPVRFYDAWEPQAAYSVALGWRQLPMLAPRTHAAMADSSFNEADLVGAGFGVTGVVPILLDVAGFVRGVDGGLVSRLGVEAAGSSRWLFVGRVAPNKCQHDVVKAFAVFRRLYDPGARLDLVGGVSSWSYARAVEGLVEGLGLSGVVRLVGSVSDEELGAYYGAADVLVCLSEHEGFCVPLLEAMSHRVPVVAFGAAAVPETVGSGGLVLGEKSPGLVAAAVARVVGDPVVREGLVAAGLSRLEDFSLDRTRTRLRQFLAPYVPELA